MAINLPPWLRRVQQSRFVQYVLVPLSAIVIVAMWDCMKHDFTNLSIACLIIGLNGAGSFIVGYIAGIRQHSPGSATFNSDGTPNIAVAMNRTQ